MAEIPGAKATGSADTRARRAIRLPWLRTFLAVLVVIVLPAVVAYLWFSAVQTAAFERRDRRVLEGMAGQLQSELATTETILSVAPLAIRDRPAPPGDPDPTRAADEDDRRRVEAFLAVSGRLRLAPDAFPERVPRQPAKQRFDGCALTLALTATPVTQRLEITVTDEERAGRCASRGMQVVQNLEDAVGFDRLRDEFDAVLVLTRDGRVVPQPGRGSAASLRPAFFDARGRPIPIAALFGPRADAADEARAASPAAAGGGDGASRDIAEGAVDAVATPLGEWLGISLAHLPRARVQGVEYLTFALPTRLHLARGVSGSEVELLLVGLVREQRFRAEALALSPTVVSVLATGVALILLSLPYVKIRFMGRRERLRRSDLAMLAVSVYFVAVLGAATVLHWGARGGLLREMDARLGALAQAMQRQVSEEVRAAVEQLLVSGGWQAKATARSEYTQVLSHAVGPLAYPLFESIFVTDAAGTQRHVWARRTSSLPLLSLGSRDYFEVAMQAPQQTLPGPLYVFDSVDGKPTGKETAVFAAPISRVPPGGEPSVGFGVPAEERDGIIALTTVLRSLSEAVVPSPYRFVVVDADGHVLFRSDGRRNRREDFFADLGPARFALGFPEACDGVPQSVRLQGRLERMVLCSLDALPVAGSGQRPATLVVLYDVEIVEALALDLFVTIVFWGTLVGLACGAALIACRAVDRTAFDVFWPTARRSRLYLVCAGGLAAFAAVLLWTPWRTSVAGYALVGAPALAVLALPLVARLVARLPGVGETHPDDPIRPLDQRIHPAAYILFGLALLLAIAIAPALVVFQDALQAQSIGRRSASQHLFAGALDARLADWKRELLLVPERREWTPGTDCVDLPPAQSAARAECRSPKRIAVTERNLAEIQRLRRTDLVTEFLRTTSPRESFELTPLRLGQPHPLCDLAPWGVYPTSDQCRGRALQALDTVPRAECSAFFLLDRNASPRRFFSLVAQTCLPAGLDTLLPVRRESLAADGSRGASAVSGELPALDWPLIGAALALLLGAFGWLFASIARDILGLDFEGDGVLDRGADLTAAIAALRAEEARGRVFTFETESVPRRWLLIEPPGELREALFALRGVWRLDLLRSELVQDRIAGKPEADDAVVVIEGVGARIDDPAWRRALERFLALVRCRALFVVSPVDPVVHLESMAECGDGPDAAAARADLPIWAALLRGFERARFAVLGEREARARLDAEAPAPAEGSATRRARALRRLVADETRWSDDLFAIGRALVARPDFATADRSRLEEHLLDAAAPFYQGLWSSCTEEERLLLHQIALEGLANPRQSGVLLRLRRRHLVRATPRFRLMSGTFRRFVLEAVPPEEVARWEQSQGESTATRIRGPLLVLAGVAGILLLVTQQTLVTSTLGLAASAVGTMGALQAVLARAQSGRGWLSS